MSKLKTFEDGATDTGGVNSVERVGNTVRRPVGPWTPAVHALLRHLENAAFSAAPRILGFDDKGREVLSFLAGSAALRPWPQVLREDRGIVVLANRLRQYHEAVGDFIPPTDVPWRIPGIVWQPGMIIRHGDLGPWNSVWQEGEFVGWIDWDFAEPGYPLEDVAQLCWQSIPMRPDHVQYEVGFERPPDVWHRFQTLCDAYGANENEVLSVLPSLQDKESERITRFGNQGLKPWTTFLARGHVEQIAADTAWLKREIQNR